MEAQVCAGIELDGTALRYAEVEAYGQKARLLRLGGCDFDFDVARMLAQSGEGKAAARPMATLGEALADVYEGTAARTLRVAMPPPQAQAFFAPAPARMAAADRQKRFRREARLLMRTGPDGLHVDARPLRSQAAVLAQGGPAGEGNAALHGRRPEDRAGGGAPAEPQQWFRVLGMSGAAHARLHKVLERLPFTDVQWTTSAEAAAEAALALQRRGASAPGESASSKNAPGMASSGKKKTAGKNATGKSASGKEAQPLAGAPFTLAIGCYATRLELALAREGRLWQTLSVPGAAPADAAYFAVSFFDALDVRLSSVEQAFVYGTHVPKEDARAFTPLRRLAGVAPEPLDVRAVLGLEPNRLDASFDTGPYVPCIGASL